MLTTMEGVMQISESHKQLLVTMLNYEIRNFLDPAIDEAHQRAMEDFTARELDKLLTVRRYMQERIEIYLK
jgi:hypothetical protein